MARRFVAEYIGIVALLATTTVVAIKLAIGFDPYHHIHEDNFKKIKGDMTRAEVEWIFGGPPGNYNFAGQSFFDGRSEEDRRTDWARGPMKVPPTQWGGDGFNAQIWFDENDRVYHWNSTTWGRSDKTTIDRFRNLLGFSKG